MISSRGQTGPVARVENPRRSSCAQSRRRASSIGAGGVTGSAAGWGVGTTRARQRCAEDNTPWNHVVWLLRGGIRVASRRHHEGPSVTHDVRPVGSGRRTWDSTRPSGLTDLGELAGCLARSFPALSIEQARRRFRTGCREHGSIESQSRASVGLTTPRTVRASSPPARTARRGSGTSPVSPHRRPRSPRPRRERRVQLRRDARCHGERRSHGACLGRRLR